MLHRSIGKIVFVVLLGVSLLLVVTIVRAQSEHTSASGLKIVDVKTQTEPLVAQAGDMVGVHYTGKLQSNGKKFDSSFDHVDPRDPTADPEPIWFKLGAGKVIKGWDEGIAGMKVGDKRQLIIPPSLAYGDREVGGGLIPANSTLVFDVELVGIYRAGK